MAKIWNLKNETSGARTRNMPFLPSTKREFDHKFVKGLCILDAPAQLEQINFDFSWILTPL